jgi:uncharacterized membrane protein
MVVGYFDVYVLLLEFSIYGLIIVLNLIQVLEIIAKIWSKLPKLVQDCNWKDDYKELEIKD